ncbi:MAG: ATP-binding cassette domain-containing protein [Selenomonadaceae bacterium]|nr:ATP-binding cassette domain-containing protein [Selenomonadaceae bacterium]
MKYKKYLPAVVANVSAALSEFLLMASSAWLIATAALHPPLSALSLGITLVRTAGISRAALRYADRFISHKIIFDLLDKLREDLFRRAAKIFPLKTGQSHEGELLHTLTVAADLLKDFLPRVILPITTAVLVVILLTYLLFAPLKIFALMLPTILTVNVLITALIPINRADDSDYRGKILDFGDGHDELNIYGTTAAINILDKSADKFTCDDLKNTARQINFDTMFKVINAVGIFILLLKLSAVVDRITLTVWALIFLALLELFGQIPTAIRTWKKIRAVNLVDEKFSSAQILQTDNAVELRSVGFAYADDFIFSDLNLTIKHGEILTIVGESGCGKTTLLYLLMGMFAPNVGTIAISGTVAAATFNNVIFASSIRDNFLMMRDDITDEEIISAMNLCGLNGFDINVPLGEDGANLSGGERLRLQIALAVAQDTDILILDEPTAGLDDSHADKLIANLIACAEQKNRTLIIITHDSNKFAGIGRFNLKTKLKEC